MDDKSKEGIDITVLIKSIWNCKQEIFKWGTYGLVLGLIISFSIPREYTSIIKVAPEGQHNITQGSMGALATMMGAHIGSPTDGLNEKMYPEIISSTPFILEFADINVEYKKRLIPLSEYMLEHIKRPWWRYIIMIPQKTIKWVSNIGKEKADTLTIKNSPAIQYAFARAMTDAIKFELDSKSGIISLVSTFQNPKVAKTISDSLTSKLQNYITKYRTAKTRQNLLSNTKMLEEARQYYDETDKNYAIAVDRNRNITSKSAEIKLDRLQNERNLAFQVYQQLAMQVETDRVKLQEETPILTIIEPSTTPIHPSAPNKTLIIIACIFLGSFAAALKISIIYIKPSCSSIS